VALIDPPRYVAIPPALIYQAQDLERETFKALLQITGWMWVTRQQGTPLRTSIDELAARWRVGRRAVYYRLRVLRQRGYLAVDRTPRGGLLLSLGPTTPAVRPLAGIEDPRRSPRSPRRGSAGDVSGGEPAPNETHTTRPREAAPNASHTRPREAAQHDVETAGSAVSPPSSCPQKGICVKQLAQDPSLSCKQVAQDAAMEANSLSEAPVRVPETPVWGQEQPTTTNTSKPGGGVENQNLLDPQHHHLHHLLMRRGQIYPDVAARLVQDPWVTRQRADAWLRALQGDRSVRNLGAVLASNLRRHREPPPNAVACPQCHNLAIYCGCAQPDTAPAPDDPWRTPHENRPP
jgi:hypothetical protein